MHKKYVVRLTAEERKYLGDFVSQGKRSAYRIKHANFLLKADADGPGWSDETIAKAFMAGSNPPPRMRASSLSAYTHRFYCERTLKNTGNARFMPRRLICGSR